jgi:uncharacterized BrkB/YihY/UPF0761 family membrane protein
MAGATGAPEAPTEVIQSSWKDVARRTVREFKDDDLTLLAAALTYYGVLSLFPGMLVLVSILGLLGAGTTQPLVDNLAALTPGPARDVVTSAIRNLHSPGGVLAVVLWVLASAAFAFYVSNFGSYNKTYGSLAAVIVFLVWLWITNVVILLGAEMNAELERERQIAEGVPPEQEPFLPPRDPA